MRNNSPSENQLPDIDRSIYTRPLNPPSAEERRRGREVAALQLIEMQKNPAEWESFVHEFDWLSSGFFNSSNIHFDIDGEWMLTDISEQIIDY